MAHLQYSDVNQYAMSKMCLESFAEDGERFCCPDIGREFAELALFALSDGRTSGPADVVERKCLCWGVWYLQ